MRYREQLQRIAVQAAKNPAQAPDLVRQMLACLDQERNGQELPAGYLYAGAHRIRARIDGLEVEAISSKPGDLELWQTGNRPVFLRVPFDCVAIGVVGAAAIVYDTSRALGASPLVNPCGFSEDGRNLFALSWKLDGSEGYQTDGEDEYLLPGSVVVGTGRQPRPMAWKLQTGQRIAIKARSLLNVPLNGQTADPALAEYPLINVEVGFYLVET